MEKPCNKLPPAIKHEPGPNASDEEFAETLYEDEVEAEAHFGKEHEVSATGSPLRDTLREDPESGA